VQAFADSCNSVFAPVADQVGAKDLVAMAHAFGFNEHPTIAYPVPESTTRRPAQMPSDLSLGVAGIGQGGVVASPLQMASVAQTIAAQGIRRPPFIIHSPRAFKDKQPPVKAVGRRVAGEVTQMMDRDERGDLGRHGRRQDRHGGGRAGPAVGRMVHRVRAGRGAAGCGRGPGRERGRRR
jgi:peptidoglycan glycosyltransferase